MTSLLCTLTPPNWRGAKLPKDEAAFRRKPLAEALISTDRDFEPLLGQIPGAKAVILRSCDYPTDVAAGVIRRNAIRIAELPNSQDRLIVLDR